MIKTLRLRFGFTFVKKEMIGMMAALFAIFSLVMALIFLHRRTTAITFVLIGIGLCLLMFWHHATDILQINW